MNKLEEFAIKHGTDKSVAGTGHHGYTTHYHEAFKRLQGKPMSLLELGVGQGASVKMWADYFPHGQIAGIDITPSCKNFEDARIRVFIGRQEDGAFMQEVIRECGPFDIVVDDGGHRTAAQIESLKILWPHVKPCGYYAIEDLGVAYDRNYKYGGGHGKWASIVEFLKDLVDEIQCPGSRYIDHAEGAAGVFFSKGLCIFKKGSG